MNDVFAELYDALDGASATEDLYTLVASAPPRRAEWCGEIINAKDLTGTIFEHKLGSLLVHKLWDIAAYDGSCVWCCENLSTGLAELWRSCDLTRIQRRGQRRNKLAYGGYRLYAEGHPQYEGAKGVGGWAALRGMEADARLWLAEMKLHGVDEADAVLSNALGERPSID
jgi:hypothetical protein